MSITGTDDYRPNYYGPYSRNVTESLERNVGLRFLKEEPHVTRREHISYKYSLATDGSSIIDKVKSSNQKEYNLIQNIVQQAKEYCGLNPYALSYAAKVHYIARQHKKPIDKRIASQLAKSFEWKMNEDQAASGINLLLALGFAREKKN